MSAFHWLFGENSLFAKVFGYGKKPQPTPPPAPPRTTRAIAFVNGTPGAAITFTVSGITYTGVLNADGYLLFAQVPIHVTDFGVTVKKDGFKDYLGTLTVPDDLLNHDIPLPALEPLVIARKGVVRTDGRNWVDDDGAFYPLGATLMWALHGWKFEQDRLKQNLEYVKKFKYDYVRILGEVNWGDNGIYPGTWADYDQVLTEFIDYAYDHCALRTELTLVGGGTGIDYVAFAQRIANLLKGREHKILDLECWNESFATRGDLNIIKQMVQVLRQNTPCLVIASSGSGDQVQFAKDSMAYGCTVGNGHLDRGFGDDGWRAVRQPWDWKDLPFACTHNEPIGPRSSVAECTDPLQLAMLRATGIVCGMGAFVLHNGAGVGGQIDPAHNRPANLWEVPGIDAIMQAVRNVDAGLPAGAGDGRHWNNQWAGNPFAATSIFPGATSGINRGYMAETPDGFVLCINGIKDHADFVAGRNVTVDFFDPIVGKIVQTNTVNAGQTVTVLPNSHDNFGDGAFIARGRWV